MNIADINFDKVILIILASWVFYRVILSISKHSVRKIKATKQMKVWLLKGEKINREATGYPVDWEKRRYWVAKQAHGKCEICGILLVTHFPPFWKFFNDDYFMHLRLNGHIHHKIPLSQNGDHSFENLALLCIECHKSAHPENKSLGRWPFGNLRD